jgi:hypothetical protein
MKIELSHPAKGDEYKIRRNNKLGVRKKKKKIIRWEI